MRQLSDGEPIYIRDNSRVFKAVVQSTLTDYVGQPIRPLIERRYSREQLTSREDCYAMDDLQRLVNDLMEESDWAINEARKIQDAMEATT